jgi:Tfp pilus assembly protein PilN
VRAVNLLPRDAIGAGERRLALSTVAPLAAAASVPVVALALVVVGWQSARSLVATRSGELAALRAELPKATHAEVAAPDYSTLVDQRTKRLAALQDALAKEMPWDTTLADLARVLPADVWLTDLTATAPVSPTAPPPSAAATTTTTTTTTPSAPSATALPTGFSISGYTFSEDDVAALIARLTLLPSLRDVTLTSTEQTVVGPKTLVQFDIVASVVPPAGSAQT